MRRRVGQAGRRVAVFGICLFMPNVLLVVFDGLSRKLFGLPQSWVADIAELTLPVAIVCCFPMAVLEHRMITIRALGKRLSPPTAKRRGWALATLDLFGAVVLALLLGTIAVTVAEHAAEVFETGRATWMFTLPLGPTWGLVAAIFALAALAQAYIVFEAPEENAADV